MKPQSLEATARGTGGNAPLDDAADALASGDAMRARRLVEPLVRADPSNAFAWFLLGNSLRAVGELDAAVEALARAASLEPRNGAAHAAYAEALSAHGETAAAIRIYREFLAAHPGDPLCHLGLAESLLARGEDEAAANALAGGARASDEPEFLTGLLRCVRRLVESGRVAPPLDLAPSVQRLSFIVCSIRPAKLERLRRNLERALDGASWELVHVPDARSLSEGYARGMQRATGETVVLCHDDIQWLCLGLGARIAHALRTADIVGIGGTTLMQGPVWSWSGAPHAHGAIAHHSPAGGIEVGLYSARGPVVAGAQSLDGVAIACRRDAAERVGWDAATFDGFHLYDADFTWRAHRAGLQLAVRTDIPVLHDSAGVFGDDWRRYAQRFLEKFPEIPRTRRANRPGVFFEVPDLDAAERAYGWIAHVQHAVAGPSTAGA